MAQRFGYWRKNIMRQERKPMQKIQADNLQDIGAQLRALPLKDGEKATFLILDKWGRMQGCVQVEKHTDTTVCKGTISRAGSDHDGSEFSLEFTGTEPVFDDSLPEPKTAGEYFAAGVSWTRANAPVPVFRPMRTAAKKMAKLAARAWKEWEGKKEIEPNLRKMGFYV